jgi:hypothetical protein
MAYISAYFTLNWGVLGLSSFFCLLPTPGTLKLPVFAHLGLIPLFPWSKETSKAEK